MAVGGAVASAHIHKRRQASVVFRRKRRFEEIDIADYIGIECREQAAKMVHLIERDIVEHIEVLVGIPAMNIHSRHAFGAFRHARLGLKRLYHVVLAKQHGCVAYLRLGHFPRPDFGSLDSGRFKTRHHHNLLEHCRLAGRRRHHLKLRGIYSQRLFFCSAFLFQHHVSALDFVFDAGVFEYYVESLAQRLVLDIYRNFDAGKQVRRVHEIHARLPHNAAEHLGGRTVDSAYGYILRRGRQSDGRQYKEYDALHIYLTVISVDSRSFIVSTRSTGVPS